MLVILAILAAIMIPALTGWIDKAKNRQVQLEARNAMLAAQAAAYEDYSKDTLKTDWAFASNATKATVVIVGTGANDTVAKKIGELTDLSNSNITLVSCEVSDTGLITSFKYVSGGKQAEYTSANGWDIGDPD